MINENRTDTGTLRQLQDYQINLGGYEGYIYLTCPHPKCAWTEDDDQLSEGLTLRTFLSAILEHETNAHPDIITI